MLCDANLKPESPTRQFIASYDYHLKQHADYDSLPSLAGRKWDLVMSSIMLTPTLTLSRVAQNHYRKSVPRAGCTTLGSAAKERLYAIENPMPESR